VDKERVKHLLCITLLVVASSLRAGTWSFAVAGDDRTDVRAEKVDPNGIHTEVLSKLLHTIGERQPAFLLFSGDLVYGENMRIPSKRGEQLAAWKKIAATEAPDLLILPVRGNHETLGDKEGTAWREAFEAGLSSNNVSWFTGQKGFSYAYIPPGHPDTAVMGLDQYNPAAPHQIDQKGLEEALAKAKTAGVKHFFPFAHEEAFTAGCHTDADDMAAYPTQRDKFLELLREYGCTHLFVGHDHFYDWMEIRNWRWPKDYVMNQIVAGTAGAPFYPDKTYFGNHDGYELTRLDHRQNTYGYLWVTVNDTPKPGEKDVTVEFVPLAP
jgi:hypothetical protein